MATAAELGLKEGDIVRVGVPVYEKTYYGFKHLGLDKSKAVMARVESVRERETEITYLEGCEIENVPWQINADERTTIHSRFIGFYPV